MEIKSPFHDTPSVTVILIGDRARRLLAEGNQSIDFIWTSWKHQQKVDFADLSNGRCRLLRGCTFRVRPTDNFLAIQSQPKLLFDHHYHSAREKDLRETRHGMTRHCGSYALCSPCLIFITCEILSKQIRFQPPDAHLREDFFPNSSLLVFDVCCFVSFGGCFSFPRCTAFCNKKAKKDESILAGPLTIRSNLCQKGSYNGSFLLERQWFIGF